MKPINVTLVKKMALFFRLHCNTWYDKYIKIQYDFQIDERDVDASIKALSQQLKRKELIEKFNCGKQKKDRITPPIPEDSRLYGAKLFLIQRWPILKNKIQL